MALHLRFRHVHRDNPLGDADLDRGEADAGRVVHRVEHILGQLPDLVRDGRGRAPSEGGAWDRVG